MAKHIYQINSFDEVVNGVTDTRNEIKEIETGRLVAVVYGFHNAMVCRDALENDKGDQN